jgi:hypothetical protein
LACTNNNSTHHITFFDGTASAGFANVRSDNITHTSDERTLSDDTDHLSHFSAGIVGYIEPRPNLQHK